jgi:[ribosomal protein S5]-alanine N-acetyltransferase
MVAETTRVILREFHKEDWKAVHCYASDTETVRFMPWGPNTEDDSKAFVDRVLVEKGKTPRKEYHFAVIEKTSGNLMGACEISVDGHEDKNGMLGYCYSREIWGRGIGTDVAEALIRFGFRTLGLYRIWAECDAENYGSQKVLEKSGMRREGCFRRKSFIKGEWRDDYHYAILREEWEGKIKTE